MVWKLGNSSKTATHKVVRAKINSMSWSRFDLHCLSVIAVKMNDSCFMVAVLQQQAGLTGPPEPFPSMYTNHLRQTIVTSCTVQISRLQYKLYTVARELYCATLSQHSAFLCLGKHILWTQIHTESKYLELCVSCGCLKEQDSFCWDKLGS